MASFDPDKYLAEKTANSSPQGFDPDKYLQEKIAPQGNPAEQDSIRESRQYDKPYEAAARGAANVGLLGYLPQVEAAASTVGSKLGDLYYGVDQDKAKQYGIKETTYDDELARAKQDQSKFTEHNPIATTVGSVGGAVLQAPAMAAGLAKAGIGAGGGLLARLGKSAAVGAGLGAVQNPGDIQPGDDQVTARAKNALLGGGLGAGGEALGSIASSAIGKLRSIPEGAQTLAANKALKAAGGMFKDFSRKDAKQLGEFAIENNLIKPGESFPEVAARSTSLKNEVGQKIGFIYDNIDPIKVDTSALRNRLLDAATEKLPTLEVPQNKRLLKEAHQWVNAIVDNQSTVNGDVRGMNDLVSELADEVNFAKKASAIGTGISKREEVLDAIRDNLRKGINEIAEASGHPELPALNNKYSKLSLLEKMATSKAARLNTNQSMGLTDKITGVGLGGGLLAHGGVAAAPQAAVIGLAGAAANKIGREYGNPLLMQGLLKGGRAAENVLGNLEGLVPEAYQGLIGKTITDPRVQLLNSINSNRDKR